MVQNNIKLRHNPNCTNKMVGKPVTKHAHFLFYNGKRKILKRYQKNTFPALSYLKKNHDYTNG